MNVSGSWRSAAATLALFGAFTGQYPAHAQVKEGVDAWSRGDYGAAVREWQAEADKGDPDAQFNLAQAYKLGRGVPQDMDKAERLFAQAAANGHLQAADNLGLILFQKGNRAVAIPLIKAASARGDPRAHYVLGVAYFNGDGVEKDWVRAYALVSLAQQAGLPQAPGALAQMDQHIPLEERQKSVLMASQIAASATATRAREVVAADLGVSNGPSRPSTYASPQAFRPAQPPTRPNVAVTSGTGGDYTRGEVPKVNSIISNPPAKPVPAPARAASVQPAVAKAPLAKPQAPAERPAPAPATNGPWRVQLGAFGVPENADRLWARVKSRPELAGHPKLAIATGRVTRLLAAGFADSASAQSACNKLKAGGFDCIATRN